jgi:hypothetical protein
LADRQLKVTVVGDTKNLDRALGRAETRLQKFGRKTSGIASSGGFSGAGGLFALSRGGAIAAGAGAGLLALKSVTDAAQRSEVILGQTSVAVEDAGLSWARYGKNVEAAALRISKSSAFDDEAVLQSFQVFVRGQKDVGRSLQLSTLAADVARGRYTDLASATQIVNKAAMGQIGALRRAGIQIDKNATATEALAALQAAYGGAAVRYANSSAGAQDKLRVSVENLQESLGKGLLPVLSDVVILMTAGVDAAGKFGSALADIGKISIPLAGDLKNLAKRFLELTPGPLQLPFLLHGLAGQIGIGNNKPQSDAATGGTSPTAGLPAPGSKPGAFFQNPPPALKTKLTEQLKGQELDARLSGNQLTLKGVLAKEAQFLQSALKDRRLTVKQKNDIKSALLGVTDEIQSIDDQIISDANDKKAAAKSAAEAAKAAAKDSKAKALEALKSQAQAFKDQADAIKSAVLSSFDTKVGKINNSRALADAKEKLRIARIGGSPEGLKLARRDVQDANLAIQRQQIEDRTFRVTEGPKGPVNTVTVGTMTFNITTSDPKAAAQEVLTLINKKNKTNAGQSRGRTPGFRPF